MQDLLPFLPDLNVLDLLGQHDWRLKQFFKDPRLRAMFTFQVGASIVAGVRGEVQEVWQCWSETQRSGAVQNRRACFQAILRLFAQSAAGRGAGRPAAPIPPASCHTELRHPSHTALHRRTFMWGCPPTPPPLCLDCWQAQS